MGSNGFDGSLWGWCLFLLTSRDLPTVRSQQHAHTVDCWRHCRLTSGEQDDLQSFLETLQQSLEALNQDSGKCRVVVQTVWTSWSNQMIQLQGFFWGRFLWRSTDSWTSRKPYEKKALQVYVLWGSNEQRVQNWQFPRVTKQSCSWNSYTDTVYISYRSRRLRIFHW